MLRDAFTLFIKFSTYLSKKDMAEESQLAKDVKELGSQVAQLQEV
jgi:hypothetical protein